MVILDVAEGEALARELIRRGILIDHRPGAGIRLSPHFYTSDEELAHALDEMHLILSTGAHSLHTDIEGDRLLTTWSSRHSRRASAVAVAPRGAGTIGHQPPKINNLQPGRLARGLQGRPISPAWPIAER
jgi:hypothetical protein